MKKTILIALAAVCLSALAASAQKFAIVNVQDVMQSMPAFADMNTKLEASSKTFETEFNSLQAELEKKYTEYQQLAPDTLPSIRDRRTQELQELSQKMQQFQETAQQELQRQQATLLQPIQEAITAAIKSVGQSGGYTFIFDSQMPYFSGTDVTDVTEQVKGMVK